MNDQGDLFDLGIDSTPARARPSDPWTSHAAARSIEIVQLRASQQAVLECFKANGPMHHQRLIVVYAEYKDWENWPRQSESGLRTRTKELVNAGLLQNTGEVVVLPSNRKSIVWEAV